MHQVKTASFKRHLLYFRNAGTMKKLPISNVYSMKLISLSQGGFRTLYIHLYLQQSKNGNLREHDPTLLP